MALKDHVTDSAKLSEDEIESIIADHTKYDPTNQSIVLLPKALELSVEKKILLYLVALRGWKFVVEENPPASDASPRDIELVTGIRGGTLRPMLRALVQSRMLESRKGRYEIPAHNLGRVREAMMGGGTTVTSRPNPESQKKRKKGTAKSSTSKKYSEVKPSLADAFEKLIQEKWFRGGKTLAQLKSKLEDRAVIVPTSHLPVHLLKACRSTPPRLVRNKENRGGKVLWVYSQQ